MSKLRLQELRCGCGELINQEAIEKALAANYRTIKCPACGVTLSLDEDESSFQQGYDQEWGRIRAQEEHQAKMAKEAQIQQAILEQKQKEEFELQQKLTAEREAKAAAEQALKDKMYRKRQRIRSIIVYVIVAGIAFVLAHDLVTFLASSKFARFDPWILRTRIDGFFGIVFKVIAIVLVIALFVGPVAGVIYAVSNRGEPLCFLILWAWLCLVVFMLAIFSSANDFTFGEAISAVLKECFPKQFRDK